MLISFSVPMLKAPPPHCPLGLEYVEPSGLTPFPQDTTLLLVNVSVAVLRMQLPKKLLPYSIVTPEIVAFATPLTTKTTSEFSPLIASQPGPLMVRLLLIVRGPLLSLIVLPAPERS